MQTRLNCIYNHVYTGIVGGAVLGYSINHGISLYFEIKTPDTHVNGWFDASSYPPSIFKTLGHEFFPITFAVVGGMIGVLTGASWPLPPDQDRDARNYLVRVPGIDDEALPINELQQALDAAGFRGEIPDCFVDPVTKQIFHDPVMLLTSKCSVYPFTSRSVNRSTVQLLEYSSDKRCPITREKFEGCIPNLELQEAAKAWVSKVTTKAKNNSLVPEYFLDPVTNRLMDNPCIVLSEDHSPQKSYDLTTIQDWQKNPETAPIKIKGYIPNRELKEAKDRWLAKKEKKYGVETLNQKYGFFLAKDNSSHPEKNEKSKQYKNPMC